MPSAQASPEGSQPVAGVRILAPKDTPRPQEVVTGYEVIPPDKGCCECETLSKVGWVWVIGLAIFTGPFCFIPCCIRECHDTCQRPTYGPAPVDAASATSGLPKGEKEPGDVNHAKPSLDELGPNDNTIVARPA